MSVRHYFMQQRGIYLKKKARSSQSPSQPQCRSRNGQRIIDLSLIKEVPQSVNHGAYRGQARAGDQD